MRDEDQFNRAFPYRLIMGFVFLCLWVGFGFVVQQNPHFPSYWFAPLMGFIGLVDVPTWENYAMWEEIMLPWLMFWLSVILPLVLPSRLILKFFRR